MVEIKTKYKWQGKDVVGNRFDTTDEAHEFLVEHGWRLDMFNHGTYTKKGPASMCGVIGVGIPHYVYVEEVKE